MARPRKDPRLLAGLAAVLLGIPGVLWLLWPGADATPAARMSAPTAEEGLLSRLAGWRPFAADPGEEPAGEDAPEGSAEEPAPEGADGGADEFSAAEPERLSADGEAQEAAPAGEAPSPAAPGGGGTASAAASFPDAPAAGAPGAAGMNGAGFAANASADGGPASRSGTRQAAPRSAAGSGVRTPPAFEGPDSALHSVPGGVAGAVAKLQPFPKGAPALHGQLDGLLQQVKAGAASAERQIRQMRAVRVAEERKIESIMKDAAAQAVELPSPGADDPKSAPGSRRDLPRGKTWPVDNGRITQNFGGTNYAVYGGRNYNGTYYKHFHNGLDIAAPRGSPLHAYDAGQVAFVGWGKGYGMHVVLAHPGGISTTYGHMEDGAKSPPVRKGQFVGAGQTIGWVGMTGMTTGPHVHFMARTAQDIVNPRDILP